MGFGHRERGLSIETKIPKKDLISYRDGEPGDLGFIRTTWKIGLYKDNEAFKRMEKKVFFEAYDAIIQTLLHRPYGFWRVACLKDSPDVILGYAVLSKQKDETILDWIYVKPLWRQIGIARDLLSPYKIKTVTHFTRMTDVFKPKRMKFNPFKL